ncbi:MAG: sulfur oxygenase reductase family protein [Proteobacteria bacterium]|nr:sulfur oxygenase reductase family protein [Pseudomonadota bacterium]MBU1419356.1 sulfur oxygenase reductase family protein [Pseudomonadota bacterium]MBU1454286.1 sulfur oxygenase reductase family protein [Pseudomonadota bacterium]
MSLNIKQLFDAEPASALYVAINRVLVKNDPNLMGMMKQASSKMCLATALTPGFKGFDLMKQLGACPMGMRWGASTDMGQQLSHIWIDQITYWDSWEAHENFHETFEDVVVNTCAKCGEVMLEGPEEPVFRVVHSDLPKLISMNQWLKKSGQGNAKGFAVDTGKTVTVLATHRIRPGKEDEFEAGEIETMNMLKESTGMIGFQILKRIGLSTLGSGHATVASMLEDLKDSSGSKLKRTAEVWEGYTIPAEYLVMVEWESLHDAQGNMPHVNVKPEILFVHGPKVLDNCLHMPNVRMADSMFREQTNREILNKQ